MSIDRTVTQGIWPDTAAAVLTSRVISRLALFQLLKGERVSVLLQSLEPTQKEINNFIENSSPDQCLIHTAQGM